MMLPYQQVQQINILRITDGPPARSAIRILSSLKFSLYSIKKSELKFNHYFYNRLNYIIPGEMMKLV